MAEDYARFLPVIDVNDGIRRVMNRKDMYLRLLGRFNPRKMGDALLADMEAGEPQKVTETAHALKGASGNLGMALLYGLCLEIETAAKAGQPTAEWVGRLRQAVDDTERMIAELLTALA